MISISRYNEKRPSGHTAILMLGSQDRALYMHFDTARANIEFTGARAIDPPLPEVAEPSSAWISKKTWTSPQPLALALQPR